ncbi:MAG: 6-phosphofructokinase [Armatimonadetes bacterium]|nr:6-phosphofructokinase [Armatimonadota bacterium]
MGINFLTVSGGGPTPVLNETLMGLVEGAAEAVGLPVGELGLYAAVGGTGGLIGGRATGDGRRHVVCLSRYLSDPGVRKLILETPSTFLGSGRYALGGKQGAQEDVDRDIESVLKVIEHFRIDHVFLVGGDDTLSTLNRLADYRARHPAVLERWPTLLAVPKTIDNDLPARVPWQKMTDEEARGTHRQGDALQVMHACPGFATAASFVAHEVLNLAVEAHALKRHYIVEVMGRLAGFLAAAASLATPCGYGPHLVAVPEHGAFNVADFVSYLRWREQRHGYGVYVVSEGVPGQDGKPLKSGGTGMFGEARVGGAGELLAAEEQHFCELAHQRVDARTIRFGELQRVCRRHRSAVDNEIAYQVGRHAALYAVAGESGKLVTIRRSGEGWEYGLVPTRLVSGQQRRMEPHWCAFDESSGIRVPVIAPSYGEEYLSALVDPLPPTVPPLDEAEWAVDVP